MRYLERKEFIYDSEIFKRYDAHTALKIYAEYVRVSSPIEYPKFYEVDRSSVNIDDLWHMPLTERTVFTRVLDVPAIATAMKPDWRLTKLGIRPTQRYSFLVANLHLQPLDPSSQEEENPIRLDYFPQRGDMIFYNGYRLMIINAAPDPKAFWGQTNIWMGIACDACIAPDGDARPIPDLSAVAPSEKPGQPVPQDWPGFPPTGPTNIPHTWP